MGQLLTLNVEDPAMMRTLRSLIKRLDGVSIMPDVMKKSVESVGKDNETAVSKEEILANMDKAFKDLKLNLEGKLEFKAAEELLNEL